jgi:hypothetical protein
MPKKRKKSSKPSQRHSTIRGVQDEAGTPQPEHPDGDSESAWKVTVEGDVEGLESLRAQFPAPIDAVAAVRSGEAVEWIGNIDGSMMRHRVLLADDGSAFVEQAVFLGSVQERVLLCAWHQTPGPERQAVQKGVLAALDELHAAVRPVLEGEIRQFQTGYTAPVPEPFQEAPEPHGPGLPVFGWRIVHPVSPETTWDDTVDTATWNTSMTMSGWTGEYEHISELQQSGFAQLLRRHGVPALLCAGCGYPITDRHPRWPGIWITPDSEIGPLCTDGEAGVGTPEPRLGYLTDDDFGLPHRREGEPPVKAQG